MKYTVEWITRWDQLAGYATPWNQLAGPVPFRRWEWLAGWWQHYGQPAHPRRCLAVGLVKDPSGAPIGFAPWYVEDSLLRGRVFRFLGDGEVCSDHLSLLCRPGLEHFVADALAQSLLAGIPRTCAPMAPEASEDPQQVAAPDHNGLVSSGAGAPVHWDLVQLEHVDVDDPALSALAQSMAVRGCRVDRAPAGHCWVIHLPPTWEAFLQRLSRSHRRQLRRIEKRYFATGRAVLHTIKDPEQLSEALDLLIRLHRQRRRQLGQPDQFVSPRFEQFHRQIAAELLATGLLQLHWLEVEGQAVAAEYHLLGETTVYAYQSGIAPSQQCPSPGQWLQLAVIRQAIHLGYQQFDFLRGDEPYKAHWRAEPRATQTLWIVAPKPVARWRHGLYWTARQAKQLLWACLGRDKPPPHPLSSSLQHQEETSDSGKKPLERKLSPHPSRF